MKKEYSQQLCCCCSCCCCDLGRQEKWYTPDPHISNEVNDAISLQRLCNPRERKKKGRFEVWLGAKSGGGGEMGGGHDMICDMT